MKRRAKLAAALGCLVLGLAGCGGDDKKDEPAKQDTTEQTTTTTTQRDPAVKAQMQAAVGGYNRGYRTFFAELRRVSSLDRLKASVADYRTVIFEFDKDIRAIEFDDSFVVQVNGILETNRGLIAQLDAIADARSFSQAQSLYGEFLKDRTPAIKSINLLLDDL